MKKLILFGGAAIVAVAVIANMSETDNGSKSETSTLLDAEVPQSNNYSIPERTYLLFIKQQSPELFISMSDDDVIAAGYAVCDALDAGVPPSRVVEIGIESADGNENSMQSIAAISGGATGILCSRHSDAWDF